jgi:uncharacterized membrane protein YhaH (DUF805 family)
MVLLVVWLATLFAFPAPSSPAGQALGWVVTILLVWINAATTVKRLHDCNWRGWWAIATFALSRLSYAYYILFLGLSFGTDISIAKMLLLVMIAVALSILQTWVFIVLFFVIGTEGSNRFGPDPTRTAPGASIAPRAEPRGVPNFLVHSSGPAAR